MWSYREWGGTNWEDKVQLGVAVAAEDSAFLCEAMLVGIECLLSWGRQVVLTTQYENKPASS